MTEKMDITDRVHGPEDLLLKGVISIYEPFEHGRCQCCGRGLSELTPFGGPGDPLEGDFTGALLVKNARPSCPEQQDDEAGWAEAEKRCRQEGRNVTKEWLKEQYGALEAMVYSSLRHPKTSWECRDCVTLCEHDYFEVNEKTPPMKKEVNAMGVLLISESGHGIYYNLNAWSYLRRVAKAYGWMPEGTTPPEGWDELRTSDYDPGPWPGSYDSNDRQWVMRTDARKMGEALDKALEDYADFESGRVDMTKRLDEGAELVSSELFSREFRSIVAEFIWLSQKGAFYIG